MRIIASNKVSGYLRYLYLGTVTCLAISLINPTELEAYDRTPLTVEINDETDIYSIAPNAEYLEEGEKSLTLEDLLSDTFLEQFTKNNKEYLNFGFTKNAYWLRVKIANTSGHPKEMILELPNPSISQIDLYQPDERGKYFATKTGTNFAFNQRPVNHRNFVFKLTFAQNETKTIYLRTKTSGPHLLPLSLSSQEYFYRISSHTDTYFGIVLGAFIALFFYNLFVFLSLRDISYLYYLTYIGLTALCILSLSGIGYKIFWSGSPWLADRMPVFCTGSMLFFAGMFTRTFLSTKALIPRYDQLIRIIIFLALLLTASPLFWSDPQPLLFLSSTFGAIFSTPFLLGAGVLTFLKGRRSARFYILAWLFLMVGTVTYGLIANGLLPNFMRPIFALTTGFPIEAILLSLALADRINIMRSEKEEAQTHALKNEHLLLETLKKGKEELEVKVVERTVELVEAKDAAEEATKLKDKFVSLLSHDLRSPLHGIISMLLLLEDKGISAKEKGELSRHILNLAEEMTKMIDNLLDISRLKTGTLKPEKKNVSISLLVEACIFKISHQVMKKKITIENNLPETLTTFADSELLGQVLQNLLVNAVKFLNENGLITIFIPINKTNGYLTIAVEDNGVGISKTRLPDIFKPEIKTNTIGTEGETGTGLGLPYCDDIMRAHKGSIRVESVEGKGSTFYIDLPASEMVAVVVNDQKIQSDPIKN